MRADVIAAAVAIACIIVVTVVVNWRMVRASRAASAEARYILSNAPRRPAPGGPIVYVDGDGVAVAYDTPDRLDRKSIEKWLAE